MSDKRVVDYFRNYKNEYGLEHLKKKVLSMGYSYEDISNALIELDKESVGWKPREIKDDILKVQEAPVQNLNAPVIRTGLIPGTVPNQNVAVQSSTLSNLTNIPVGASLTNSAVSAPITQPVQQNVNNAVSGGPAVPLNATATPYDFGADAGMKTKGSVWFKIAGISGILGFLLLIVAGFLDGIVNQSLMLGALFLFLIYFVGFIILGKRHNKKLISIVSWIFIILIFLSIVLIIVMMIKPDLELISKGDIFSATSLTELWDAIKEFGTKLLIIFGSIFGVLFILGILFGVGFLKLKNDVKLAKVTGMLFLIGTITNLILIGPLILFVAFVLSVVILTKEK